MRRGILAFIIALCGCAHAPDRTSQDAVVSGETGLLDGAIVDGVELIGASAEFAASLRSKVESRSGASLNREQVREDIQALIATEMIRDVRVFALPTSDKPMHLSLRYQVSEHPRLTEILIDSTPADASRAEIVKSFLLGYLDQMPVSPVWLRRFVAHQTEQAVSEGYSRASISAVLEPTGEGKARVRLRLRQGPRLTVGAIQIRGALQIPEAEIGALLTTYVGKVFVSARTESDALAIEALYSDRGMVNANVEVRNSEVPGASADQVAVTFEIYEGEVFRMGEINVLDPLHLSASAAGLKTRPNQPYSRRLLVQDVEFLKAHALSLGTEVEVTPVPLVNLETKTVDMTIHITKAP